MFSQLVNLLTKNKKKKQEQLKIAPKSGKQLKQKLSMIAQQFPLFNDSIYFSTHLQLITNMQNIEKVFGQKIKRIQKNMNEKKAYQMQLASIILNINEPDGLFYMFIKMWISFCTFQLNKIEQNKQISIADKSKSLIKLFHKQFFLLSFFIYQLCLYIYQQSFNLVQNLDNDELFKFIRNNITTVRQFSQVHEIMRMCVKCEPHYFQQNEIAQNMQELQKICKISTIPAAFLQSEILLKQFNKTAAIDKKMKKAVQLIDKLKQEMGEYRRVNEMNQIYAFCADDVLSAITYVMWRLMKNIYGACAYTQAILCCQYQQIKYQYLSNELDRFGDCARHSFDTIKSVAMIGLVDAETAYSL